MQENAINNISQFILYQEENVFSLKNKNIIEIFLSSFFEEKQENQSIETSIYLSPYKIIEEFEKIYIYENPQQIKTFLISNTDLIPILKEAPEYIYKIFGKFPIYLEIHHDPEEGWDELFIIIKTSYTPEKAIELEKKLFDEWFVKIIHKVGNKLNFMEEPL
ncbi:MAG TPA: hypothetical protein PLW61_05805 [Caldisericia bacterium]|nr:hypothetical protein [Caldisericia bacterium]HPB34259.1 hypothetical protein [Caldisericia bacterium]HQL65938.1 hypothetical protein [Caldisericia bacterium]HQN48668.1 hypothetical protein [Caldisericia bacterium]HQO99643.1 hypothetical protein [Caldisericia bacterium]